MANFKGPLNCEGRTSGGFHLTSYISLAINWVVLDRKRLFKFLAFFTLLSVEVFMGVLCIHIIGILNRHLIISNGKLRAIFVMDVRVKWFLTLIGDFLIHGEFLLFFVVNLGNSCGIGIRKEILRHEAHGCGCSSPDSLVFKSLRNV